jgi:crossover junction endodeoxyribonuclease RuvC
LAEKLDMRERVTIALTAVGIDPGTRHLGWGVVRRDGNRLRHIDHGVIHLDAKQALHLRLRCIDEELGQVLARHHPAVGSVESLFFHKDAQAAAKLGHARGVVLLALARAGIEVAEYAPARVKRTVTGHGQADKQQVARMVCTVLGLENVSGGDAADALALAVTHLRLGASVAEVSARPASAPDARGNPALARLLAAQGGRGRRRRAF